MDSKELVNALSWWGKLSLLKKRYYEMSMFGHGEFDEDPSLHELDIIKMFREYSV